MQTDKIYHDMLKDMSPGLYDVVKQLVESKQSPQAIAKFVEQRAGRDSVLPGLVEGAGREIKRQQQK